MYERYCALRDINCLKDSFIASCTHITPSTFTDWKKGKSQPNIDKIIKLADFFGVTTDFLLKRTDYSVCPTCYFIYFPLDKSWNMRHNEYHEKYVDSVFVNQQDKKILSGFDINLTDDEVSHLKKYRLIGNDGRKIIDSTLDASYRIKYPDSDPAADNCGVDQLKELHDRIDLQYSIEKKIKEKSAAS